ncbi:MAG TPA: hypothetical protein DCS91_14905 [Microcoleaceae bacterium UBA11344]|jgi:hypothetical protein|nr:hypothetical protein [Microcoleaceae cyanobacterium UBA11344]
MGKAKRRKQTPNYRKPTSQNKPTSVKGNTEIHNIDFPITPRKACELNQRLREEGWGLFYKEFMSQNNMLTSRYYRTEVILTTTFYDSKFSVEGKDFYVPIVCFHPQSNIVKVLGLKHDEIVLVSRFHYFEQIQRKVIKPQFFGCVKMLSKNIIPEYGYVGFNWHSFDWKESDENSLIINTLRNSEDNQEEKVKTITEREELGISADRVLITVRVYYPDEHEGQKCQEVLVFLLNNGIFDDYISYDHRITTLINKNLGDNWLKISCTGGLYSSSYCNPN